MIDGDASAVIRSLRQGLADAWEAGYCQGFDDRGDSGYFDATQNPYAYETEENR